MEIIMINIAILGFGNIGSGVAELIDSNGTFICKEIREQICIKYILDLREFKGTPYESRVVHDIGIIANDPEVSIVCEMMGGSKPAFEYSMKCLQAGKHVITSNKEVVANFGNILCDTARDNGVRYMYEASVGGGIPVIRTIRTAFAGTEITAIHGILNGTTNYILTEMARGGKSFDHALDEAKRLGYAEANPNSDINGDDACRKICILAALAFGSLIPISAVNCVGVSGISVRDFEIADKFGATIKLIASASRTPDGTIDIRVSPCLLESSDVMAAVNGVYNAIRISAKHVGDVMLYGQGAGKLPTAGAVVSDLIEVAGRLDSKDKRCCQEAMKCADTDLVSNEYTSAASFYAAVEESAEKVLQAFADARIVYSDGSVTAFICDRATRQTFEAGLKNGGFTVLSYFRKI